MDQLHLWHKTTEVFGVNDEPHKCKGETHIKSQKKCHTICPRIAELSVQNLSIFSLKIKVKD